MHLFWFFFISISSWCFVLAVAGKMNTYVFVNPGFHYLLWLSLIFISSYNDVRMNHSTFSGGWQLPTFSPKSPRVVSRKSWSVCEWGRIPHSKWHKRLRVREREGGGSWWVWAQVLWTSPSMFWIRVNIYLYIGNSLWVGRMLPWYLSCWHWLSKWAVRHIVLHASRYKAFLFSIISLFYWWQIIYMCAARSCLCILS